MSADPLGGAKVLVELPCRDCEGEGFFDDMVTEDGGRILHADCDGTGLGYAQREFWTGGWTYLSVPAPIGVDDP